MAHVKGLVSLVETKMNIVASQRDTIHHKVDSYIDMVMASAKSALEAEGQDTNTFRQLNPMLDASLEFLLGLGAHMDDAATSYLSVKTPDYQNPTEVKTETCCSETVKQLEARLGAAEDGINQTDSKFLAKMEELKSTIMLQIEQRLNEVDINYNDREKQLITRLDEVDQQLCHVDAVKQSDLGTVKKRLRKLENAEKENSSCLDSLVQDIETLKAQQSRKLQSPQLDSLEKQVEDLISQSSLLQNQLGDVQHLQQTTEMLNSRMETLVDKSELISVMKTTNSVKAAVEELSARVNSDELLVKGYRQHIEREEKKRKDLENKLATLAVKRSKDSDLYDKRLNEVESLFKQVCVIVDDRVQPLRRLLRILNEMHKKVEKREELSWRLDALTKQVRQISAPNLSTVTTIPQAPVGFTAYHLGCRLRATDGSDTKTVIVFENVRCNEGDRYNPTTGVFTVPQNGLYITFITLRQIGEGETSVNVTQENTTGDIRTYVCRSVTYVNKSTCCGVGLAYLKEGDKLFVALVKVTKEVELSPYSSFSCVLIR